MNLAASPAADRLVWAMYRLGRTAAAIEFAADHIEADAVHEQLVRHGVIAPLLAAEPQLTGDTVLPPGQPPTLAYRQPTTRTAPHRTDDQHIVA